jgi:dethiobiotin synthetase
VSARPATLVLVAGTGTGVGKTWWTAAVARRLRATGVRVGVRKPVQSGPPGAPTDADVLAAASGEDPAAVCRPDRSAPLAWAPPMAAARLGLPPWTVADLAAELRFPEATEVGLVESAGGARSPIAADGDTVDLAGLIEPDLVVVVADAGLGTINAVRLTAEVLGAWPIVVALNRYTGEPLHQANRDHLAARVGLDVVTEPDELVARLDERFCGRGPGPN